ncbi:uncharacterized protein LOC119953971 [Scyliorhinus canicula]|uniref:uncharacterized protein LOC119953971 n=1 Tax=Scyliorhinus canicula TaxID=7830 RepID=UPI0018F5B3C1|nr:uncharacterized protein LOC119953971 [Scyliorhinus canicula]
MQPEQVRTRRIAGGGTPSRCLGHHFDRSNLVVEALFPADLHQAACPVEEAKNRDTSLDNGVKAFGRWKEGPKQDQSKINKKENRRKMTAAIVFFFIAFVHLRATANPLTPTPAVNVSQTQTTPSPVDGNNTPTWCTRFMTWYSLSYVIESLLALAIVCILVQTLRMRKWRRRAYRYRTSTVGTYLGESSENLFSIIHVLLAGGPRNEHVA